MPNFDSSGGVASTKNDKILEIHVERLLILEKNFSDIEHQLYALKNRLFGEEGQEAKNVNQGNTITARPCAVTSLNETVERIVQQQIRIGNIASELVKLA